MNATTERMWDSFVADFIFGNGRLNAHKRRERKVEVHMDAAWLPEGWTFEALQHKSDVVYIERPDAAGGGCVWVDFRLRRWYSEPPGLAGSDGYGGRNWKRRAVADACAWLKETPARRT